MNTINYMMMMVVFICLMIRKMFWKYQMTWSWEWNRYNFFYGHQIINWNLHFCVSFFLSEYDEKVKKKIFESFIIRRMDYQPSINYFTLIFFFGLVWFYVLNSDKLWLQTNILHRLLSLAWFIISKKSCNSIYHIFGH